MPKVSIIVPCYNERKTIRLLLDSLLNQSYPLTDMEVIISDAQSTDGTREEIIRYQEEHPELSVSVVDNHDQTIPSGLNKALESAKGEYIVRMDAHSLPNSEYVKICIQDLEAGYGDTVGGVWTICSGGHGWLAESIAEAAAHPLGAGDAHYRLGGSPQAVDTVPFGAYHRSLVERIGKYDETLLSNEDYEFNVRVRRSGGRVWLDPAIQTKYFARKTITELARQYWRYGYWKAKMLQRYPRTIRWRQLLPPLFVISILLMLIGSFVSILTQTLLAITLSFYFLVLLAAGLQIAIQKKRLFFMIGVPIAVAIMHLSWGSAFIWSLIKRND